MQAKRSDRYETLLQAAVGDRRRRGRSRRQLRANVNLLLTKFIQPEWRVRALTPLRRTQRVKSSMLR